MFEKILWFGTVVDPYIISPIRTRARARVGIGEKNVSRRRVRKEEGCDEERGVTTVYVGKAVYMK